MGRNLFSAPFLTYRKMLSNREYFGPIEKIGPSFNCSVKFGQVKVSPGASYPNIEIPFFGSGFLDSCYLSFHENTDFKFIRKNLSFSNILNYALQEIKTGALNDGLGYSFDPTYVSNYFDIMNFNYTENYYLSNIEIQSHLDLKTYVSNIGHFNWYTKLNKTKESFLQYITPLYAKYDTSGKIFNAKIPVDLVIAPTSGLFITVNGISTGKVVDWFKLNFTLTKLKTK